MIRRAANVIMTVIPLVAACNLTWAQQPPTATVTVDIANAVEHQEAIYDPVKFARNPNITPSLGIGTGLGVAKFTVVTIIGDIVAVNGQSANGLYADRSRAIGTHTNTVPGQAIGDARRAAMREHVFEIQQSDRTQSGASWRWG